MKPFRTKYYCLLLCAIAAFSFLLVSCEKEVHISLASSPAKVVVQGAIETNVPPYVVLTSTISFFSTIDLNTLQNSFLHGATIEVGDGVKTVTLREYSFDTGTSNKFYVYSIDTSNPASLMLGQTGKTYSLKITYNGSTYTSVTSIPNPKGLDSVWFAAPLFARSTTPDSAYQLFGNYTDPDTMGNYVRYFTQRGHGRFFPSGIFSDDVINGKVVRNIGMYGGYEETTNGNANRDSLIYFFPGDTVTLKWCEIDKGVFKFWNTMQFAQNAVGNPFATPINVQSNISNGAQGVWAGYGSLLITRVVP